MRKIKYVVLHHSITPRDLDFEKSLKSFDNNHRERLTEPKKIRQPLSWVKATPNIAYHFCISGIWEVRQTRLIENVGYHAGLLSVNKESIWICIIGNFDEETPSVFQYEKLNELLKSLDETFDYEILLHSEVPWVTKSCPGANFDKSKVYDPTMWKNERLFKLWSSKGKSNRLKNIDEFTEEFTELFPDFNKPKAKDFIYKILIALNTRPNWYPRKK